MSQVETVGSVYMACSGLPWLTPLVSPVVDLARFGLDLIDAMAAIEERFTQGRSPPSLRAGGLPLREASGDSLAGSEASPAPARGSRASKTRRRAQSREMIEIKAPPLLKYNRSCPAIFQFSVLLPFSTTLRAL